MRTKQLHRPNLFNFKVKAISTSICLVKFDSLGTNHSEFIDSVRGKSLWKGNLKMGQRCVTQSNPAIFTVNFKNFRYFQQDA